MRKFFALFSGSSDSQSYNHNNVGADSFLEDDHEFFCSNATTSTAAPKAWNPEFASDPNAWEKEFLFCWEQLKKLIFANAGTNDIDVHNIVKRLLGRMSNLLIMEINSQPEAIIGPILDHCFNDEVFLYVHNWAVSIAPVLTPRCQVMLLETYEDIVNRTQSHNHCPLVHKPILIPLLRLLYWCKRSAKERKAPSSEVDKYFVRALNQICKKIAEDSTLLEFFFNPPFSLDQEIENELENEHLFLVFNLLIPYMHTAEDVGQLARDALLQIMSVSRDKDYIAKHISGSTFCPVLATGISGFWSELPRSVCTALCVTGIDEFHKLNLQTDLDAVPELVEFHKALLFCNAVVQDSHDEIVRHIIHYFYDGFLCTVFKAAVEQLDTEDLVSTIVYFHLCLETVSEEPLIQALLKVLLIAETNDHNMNLFELILSKMNESEKLCRVVLSLLRTLLELRCEDLIWNCLMRFILPFIPLKPTRRFDVNISLNAADRFLSCIPECTRNIFELNSDASFQEYLQEAAELIERTTICCQNWAFNYDGIKPNSLLNIAAPEELLSTRQPFVRLSSARSSFASNGLNRYFQDRSAHGTLDSTHLNNDYATVPENVLAPLNKLGEDDARDLTNGRQHSGRYLDKLESLFDSGQDEYDFNCQYELMSTADNPHLDYFHFTYEGISSESDEMNNSRRNSNCYADENVCEPKKINATPNFVCGAESDDGVSSAASSLTSSTRYARAVRAIDWEKATSSLENFYDALDGLALVENDSVHTVEENIALIDARFQYLKEIHSERAEMENLLENSCNPFSLDFANFPKENINGGHSMNETSNSLRTIPSDAIKALPQRVNGFLLTCTDEKGSGLFLESLFSALEKLVDRSFTTNLQLVGVLRALMSHPQPVIISYLLYVDSIKSNALLRITNILETLKVRIDAYASSIDGFEDMLRRGLRHKITRVERFEKSGWSSSAESCASLSSARRHAIFTPENNRMHSGNPSFRFTHKAIESQEQVADSSRNRNFAYAAILLSQLCQLCAAFSLQHNTPPIFNTLSGQNIGNY